MAQRNLNDRDTRPAGCPAISLILPAYNEAGRIERTLAALKAGMAAAGYAGAEIIVVDDGSDDHTQQLASLQADRVIRHPRNRGKGVALETGWRAAGGSILLFLDADLGDSARYAPALLEPVLSGEADMAIAVLPPPKARGGFGLVKRLAGAGIYWLSGHRTAAPLSGQRCMRREVLEAIGGLAGGFGIEVGLTIDAARRGFRIVDVEVPFAHRETGRDLDGFRHRGKQLAQVAAALASRWRSPAW